MNIEYLKFKIVQFLDKYIRLISLGIFVAILSFGTVFYIKPFYDKASQEIAAATEKYEKQFKEKIKQEKLLKDVVKEFENIDPIDSEIIEKILPQDDNYLAVLPMLEYLVVKNGFVLTGISAVDPTLETTAGAASEPAAGKSGNGSENIRNFKVTLNIGGINYEGLKRLLSIFENNMRLTDVRMLNFNPGGKSATFALEVYYWNQPLK
jgi:hypothetical protein